MIWRKDKLRATQPYFVLQTEDFRQKVYLHQGISHFYTFHVAKELELYAVPDGCIDLIFEFEDGDMQVYACGTVLEYCKVMWKAHGETFGVRFFPGYQPAGLQVCMKDLVGNRYHLAQEAMPEFGFERLKTAVDFEERIEIFLEEYTKLEAKREKPFGKRELVQSVKNMVYESDGKILVSQLQERTGYTDRYINKVFIEEMGFSPKTFCKIIQFQRTLEFLNYGAPDQMTEAAVYLGYYDQSQFIRDFKKYAGTTPKKYLKLILENNYAERVKDTNGQEKKH